MGQPVKIVDVARQLVESADAPVEIVYTGLKPGEKLHEVLLGTGESDVRPFHPFISHVHVPPVAPHDIRALALGPKNGDVEQGLIGVSDQMRHTLEQSVRR